MHPIKIKAIGFALAAMLAMSAVAASSASAEFTVEPPPIVLTGEELKPGAFAVTGIEVECETTEYEGEITESRATEITVSPTFAECEGGGLNIDVTGFTDNDPEGSECHFVLDTDGTADLECAEGGEITIESEPSVCIVHIPPQEGLGEIEYTGGTREGKHDLTLDIGITEITATHTDGFLCPMTGSGEASSGTLTGEVTAWAETAGNSPLHLTHPDWESR